MSKFPSKQQLEKAMKKLAKADASRSFPKDADQLDKFKYSLCQEIFLYKLENDMTLDEMAELLGLSKSDVSKIINYHIKNQIGPYIKSTFQIRKNGVILFNKRLI